MHATSEQAQVSPAARFWLSVGSLLALHIRDSAGLVGLTSRAVPALALARLTALDRSSAAAQWDRCCPEPELVLSSPLLWADAPELRLPGAVPGTPGTGQGPVPGSAHLVPVAPLRRRRGDRRPSRHPPDQTPSHHRGPAPAAPSSCP